MSGLDVAEAFTSVPTSAAEAKNWIGHVLRTSHDNRCWRCELSIQELDDLDHDVSRWSVYMLEGGRIVAQSCTPEAAELFQLGLARFENTIAKELTRLLAAGA